MGLPEFIRSQPHGQLFIKNLTKDETTEDLASRAGEAVKMLGKWVREGAQLPITGRPQCGRCIVKCSRYLITRPLKDDPSQPSTSTTTKTPIITIKNNAAITNSRNVAEYFGKEHRSVTAKIDALVKELPVPHAYFQAGVYKHPDTGDQLHNCYDVTRDGFTLLAMGFTGRKALGFKLKYIQQFNVMEEMLKAPVKEQVKEEPMVPMSVVAIHLIALLTYMNSCL